MSIYNRHTGTKLIFPAKTAPKIISCHSNLPSITTIKIHTQSHTLSLSLSLSDSYLVPNEFFDFRE